MCPARACLLSKRTKLWNNHGGSQTVHVVGTEACHFDSRTSFESVDLEHAWEGTPNLRREQCFFTSPPLTYDFQLFSDGSKNHQGVCSDPNTKAIDLPRPDLLSLPVRTDVTGARTGLMSSR